MSRVVSVFYPEAVQMAAEVLQSGGLIVLPTDTVYGVGSLIEASAIERLFTAKQRPPERAVPVLLADISAVARVAHAFPDPARRLAEAFWPGPLTLALPKRTGLPPNLSGLPTVGVRVPDHPQARAVIAGAGGALAVTSANRSSKLPARTIQAAIEQLSDAVALYLDGGLCPGGVPSTVVTFEDGELRVLRVGPLSETALRAVLGG
jgi:L-threonylcarbamoyladenylate synthase